VVLVPTTDRFDLNLEAIERSITPKTRAILVNSPNNPTGVVYPKSTLERLAEILTQASQRHGRPIYLLSDEPYRHIVVPGVEVPHIQTIYPQTIVATSHSKDLGLPGERIGQVILGPGIEDPATFVSALSFSMRALGFVNAPALMQRVLARIGNASIDTTLYHTNRTLLVESLRTAGLELIEPQGAFYLFPKTPDPDDVAYCRRLARKGLLIVPGTGFGCPGYARIAYCVPTEKIQKAADLLTQESS
jgi:aspartate aminotransferase